MRLTRRDAVTALLAGGTAGVAASALPAPLVEIWRTADGRLRPEDIDVVVAVAEVVYPSEVEVTREYVSDHVTGLPEERQRAIATTVRQFEEFVSVHHGASFAELSERRRDSVLRAMGVDKTGSSPSGSLPERVRFHLVNQLIYALFTAPRGSRLVGIDNPIGYPGGYDSYQEPPTDE